MVGLELSSSNLAAIGARGTWRALPSPARPTRQTHHTFTTACYRLIDLSENPASIFRSPHSDALMLAPHPDDFDCIAATMELIRDAGISIELVVLTGAASGVDDDFCRPCTNSRKAEMREAEQRESCRLFGLPDDHLRFLDLEEDESGHPIEHSKNSEKIHEIWVSASPGVVFMPHYNDTNVGHRRVHRMFSSAVASAVGSATVLLNEDPKTRAMRTMAHTPFDEEVAHRKAELLRCHLSQQSRNLKTRGYGLDERILEVNRRAASRLGLTQPYAETFEIEHWEDGRLETTTRRAKEARREVVTGDSGRSRTGC